MINFAHRGNSSEFPENTILSFKEAVKANADAIELDVHKTKDNKLVVIHDEEVDRTFLGRGYVKDYTLTQIKSLKCRKYNFRNNDECIIPTLEEVLELIKYTPLSLNIEIKNDKVNYENIEEDVINLINKYDMKKRVIISSFNHKALLKCKEIDDEIETGMLYDSPIPNLFKYAKEHKVNALHPSFFCIREDIIKEAHKNNLKVNVYTINIVEIMKLLMKWDIDGIITDCPKKLEKLLR